MKRMVADGIPEHTPTPSVTKASEPLDEQIAISKQCIGHAPKCRNADDNDNGENVG
ncbi:hypothetical protein FHS27_003921 [Rhodopirellula rubra]|uniref:Uncharacterized protein n=1 Tax=Aporhodopirellula rubra TaxID=980271 RepID=A0A7W5E0R4_9BACT|nr:hypothetical protein [Aporhodopirellula rubra]MBB3208094.1 hypothetical protein [Aporhodopirellula rubra]